MAAAITLAACQIPEAPEQPVEPGISRAELVDRLGQPCQETRSRAGDARMTKLGFFCVREIPRLDVWLEDDEVVRSQQYD